MSSTMILRAKIPLMTRMILAIATAIVPTIDSLAASSALETSGLVIPEPENDAGSIDSSRLLKLPGPTQADMLAWVGVETPRMPKSMTPATRGALLQTIWYEARRAGLEPATVLAVVDVASSFRKYYIGPADVRGYMAVAPHWVKELGDGRVDRLFVMQVNLRYGCTILRHDLDSARGDLGVALQLYQVQQAPDVDRPRGKQSRQFADAVGVARRRWLTDVETPAALK